MSLAKINVKLKELGLSYKERRLIIEMVREFGFAVLQRHTRFLM